MPFNMIVIVREVWDTRDLAVNVLDENGKIKESALTTRFEPEDLNALEMALQIKDKHGGKVTALSLGDTRSVDVLKECLYRGVDEVVRVSDPNAKSLDTEATANLIVQAIRKIGAFDLILSGVTVVEGENSLLGAHVAGVLGIEPINWVDSLVEIAPGRVVARRAIEMGYESIEAPLPALLVVGVALLKEDPRSPRSAKAMLKLKHKKTEIPVWTSSSLGVENVSGTTSVAGLEAIPQRVIQSKDVDPADEAALKTMLDEILKGE